MVHHELHVIREFGIVNRKISAVLIEIRAIIVAVSITFKIIPYFHAIASNGSALPLLKEEIASRKGFLLNTVQGVVNA